MRPQPMSETRSPSPAATSADERHAPLAMPAHDFRAAGHALVDAVADFLAGLPERPVTRGETPDAAAARAAETLASVPGVTEARALEKEKAYALIKPWLGDIADLDDLPVPRLVAVGLDRKNPATAETLGKALKARGLDAVVDDHSVWIKDIRGAGLVPTGE